MNIPSDKPAGLEDGQNLTGWQYLNDPRICPTGFREYDARWKYPEQINLAGFRRAGSSLGALMREVGVRPEIVVGHDFREYSPSLANGLMLGLIDAGIKVLDIGMVLSPMAYFSRVCLDVPSVAMITASHNPNGWTGLKVGFRHPLTLGEAEISRWRDIALGNGSLDSVGGTLVRVPGLHEQYLDDVCGSFKMRRRLTAVCATGNGTASAFAPRALERIGVNVIRLHCEPDLRFPNYNPNPEALEMLDDMSEALLAAQADIALGFDGDGDRLGVIDEKGQVLFSDKLGVLLARRLARQSPGARFVVDIKSTSIFQSDAVLHEHGAEVEYWKTGHSHLKQRMHATGALAAFEKSGHFYFGPPAGRGYDDGILAAVELCRLLDENGEMTLSELGTTLRRTWSSPTMSPECDDREKYGVVERVKQSLVKMQGANERIAGLAISDINTVNGVRCTFDNGSWGLVRASSNTPSLVVVCESVAGEDEMRAIFRQLDAIVRATASIGPYDQQI